MTPVRMVIFIGLWIALALPSGASAREGGEIEDIFALFAEERIVITPSRYPQPLNRSPSTVTVITSEEIRRSGATAIPDLLRRVPGMEVMQTTSAEYLVSIRGDNQLLANKLLVLIDGRTFQEEVENTVPWTVVPIAMEEIERIEIIRGPGSAVWGANAFDGVVNIITRDPKDRPGTSLSFTGGGLDTVVGGMVHTGTAGPVDYRLSLGFHQADGYESDDRRQLSIYRGNALLRYRWEGDRSISLSGGVSASPRYAAPVFDNARGDTDVRYDYLQLDYESPASFARFYWNRFDLDLLYVVTAVPIVERLRFSNDLYSFEARHQIRIAETHTLTGGIHYRLNDAWGDFIDRRHRLHLLGFYVQDEWNPIPSVTLIFGGRYDYQSTIHHTFSPRGSLLYRFPTGEQTLRLAAGLAYRAPTPVELYELDGGNNDLDSERIVSYELTYTTFLFQRLRTEVALFYNRLWDLIDVQETPNVNQDRAEIYGGEIGGELLITSWISLFANYGHQQIRSLNSPDIPEFERAGPKHKVNGGIRIDPLEGLGMELTAHYVSKVRYLSQLVKDIPGRSPVNPSYTLVNLWVGYRPWDERLELAFSAFNLFKETHRENPRGDQIGRRLLGHLRLRF